MKKNFLLKSLVVVGVFIMATILATEIRAASEARLSKGQTIYVPIYSHVYGGDRQHPYYLAATLSIRNTDLSNAITLVSVEYYDTSGKLLSRYVKNPQQLNALASTYFIIKQSDKSGGVGASFIVKWKAENAVNKPVMEGVMIGTQAERGISFVSRGQVLKEEAE